MGKDGGSVTALGQNVEGQSASSCGSLNGKFLHTLVDFLSLGKMTAAITLLI